MKTFLNFCFYFLLVNNLISQISPFIQIDQFGYAPHSEKVAVISNPIIGFNSQLTYQAPLTLEVKRASDQQTVFTGGVQIWKNGQMQSQSGDIGWWFDFSALQDTGSFYIYDSFNNQTSGEFQINQNPYSNVLKAAGRMYYYNRCNDSKELPYAGAKWTDGMNFMNPQQDANCRYVYDKNNISKEKDLRGGWFDAGDYNKYVTFTFNTIHDLLYAFEENPEAFGDDWNIPESNNGFPDLLDELKWELDWLQRMVNPDGSVHLKMGSIDYAENALSPPSANFDKRYYGPICSSASVTVASVFGHAAVVMKNIKGLEGYGNQLQEIAESCFDYCMPFSTNNTWQTNCDDGTIKAGDADESAQGQLERMISASVYLYELTGQAKYHDYFINNYLKATPLINSFWSGDLPTIQDALIRYAYKLSNTNKTVKDKIQSNLTTAINNNWNGFFGWSEEDLYRAYTPDWTYHWGSNKPKAAYGTLNMNIAHYNMVNDSTKFAKKAIEQLHYFHGVNPLGLVMLSNMYPYGAEKSVNQIYHSWFNEGTVYDDALLSPNGPAPGFVTGGPNANFSVSTISPPANQPAMKSYLDFNNGWPENSWEISEPAIYSQAAYIRLLANQVGTQIITSTNPQNPQTSFNVYPNPADNWIIFSGFTEDVSIKIIDQFGSIKIYQKSVHPNNQVDISGLINGVYMVVVTENGLSKIYTNKLCILR
jgi:endoglucanase